MIWLFVKMWFKVHQNVNDIRTQIIVLIKKHIIILFTHKSIHNSDRKGIKYRMSYPRWSTSLVVNKQFVIRSIGSWSKWYNAVVRCEHTVSTHYKDLTKRVDLIRNRHYQTFIECSLFSPWYSWKIALWC